MPLILMIMDGMVKGRPVSSAYFDLWCRAFDECFVPFKSPIEMAFSAGFTGQRGEQTWITRIKSLASLGFINLKSGPYGPVSYAVILNPYTVIKEHREKKSASVAEDAYNALLARAAEIGANDLRKSVKKTVAVGRNKGGPIKRT